MYMSVCIMLIINIHRADKYKNMSLQRDDFMFCNTLGMQN